jgi:hypothetical protein
MLLQTLPAPLRRLELRRVDGGGLNAGIKAARPAPLIEIGGNAGPLGNRANRNVTINDDSSFPMAIVTAAACECEHSAL